MSQSLPLKQCLGTTIVIIDDLVLLDLSRRDFSVGTEGVIIRASMCLQDLFFFLSFSFLIPFFSLEFVLTHFNYLLKTSHFTTMNFKKVIATTCDFYQKSFLLSASLLK